MHTLLSSFLTLSLLFCFSAKGSNPVAKVVITQPNPAAAGGDKKLCRNAFAKDRIEDHYQAFENRFASHRFPEDPAHPPLHKMIPEIIFKRWAENHGYNSQQIEQLRETNESVDPQRASYLGYTEDTGFMEPFSPRTTQVPFSGFRIIDGSTRPLFNGGTVDGINPNTRFLTFEKDLESRGYRLPERVIEELTGRPAHIWEIGLINVERDYKYGIHTLLGTLSRHMIDDHYNLSRFRSAEDLSSVLRNNLVIYAVGRKANVRINRAFGMELVLDRYGEPVTTSQGLFLMKVQAAEVLKRFSDFEARPIKREESPTNPETGDKDQRLSTKAFLDTLKAKAPILKSSWDLNMATFRLSYMHHLLFHTPLKDLEDHPALEWVLGVLRGHNEPFESFMGYNRYQIFFEAYYRLAYSDLKAHTATKAERDFTLQYYEILVMNFPKHQEMHEDLIDGVNKKVQGILPFWGPYQMRQFMQRYGDLYDAKPFNSPFLELWMPENKEEIIKNLEKWNQP